MANALIDPPFAADPPVKLNVNAKILGLVIGILALIGAILALVALPVVFALNNAVNDTCRALGLSNCGTTGIFGLALIGVLVALGAAIIEAIGGFRMYQGDRQGKEWVIYGLALGLIGGILEIIGYGGIGGFIFNLIIAFVIYYLVVISRFPGEAPLAPSTGGGYGGGGYGSPPPPPPPA